MFGRIFHSWVWSRGGIPADDWEDRWDLRVWLPLWDLLLIGGGIWATAFGSPILHRLFPDAVIDFAGIALALAATVCLMGVQFPPLWLAEFFGKVTVMSLLAMYAACVLLFRADPADMQSGFVVFILCCAIVPAPSRLSKIGEQWKKRRDLRAKAEAALKARAEATPDGD